MAEVIEHQVDCASGDAVDWLLDGEELERHLSLRQEAERQAASAAFREAALGRLRCRAKSSEEVHDILTVLGLL